MTNGKGKGILGAKVDHLTREVRQLINNATMRHLLAQDLPKWNSLCSALDVIGDTVLAIQAYFGSEEEIHSTGALYLNVYGVLQACYVQQDAVKEGLCDRLGVSVDISQFPWCKRVRDVRNSAIGHPTRTKANKNRGVPGASHSISRLTMKTRGFQLLSYNDQGRSHIDEIDIAELIEGQEEEIAKVLRQVAQEIWRLEMEHRRRFKSDKLAALFPETLIYSVEKLFEISKPGGFGPALWGIGEIRKVLESIQAKLEERAGSIGASPSIADTSANVEYALGRLERFAKQAQNGGETGLDEKEMDVFAYFVRKEMEELKRMVGEIDEAYA